ncbi:MAG: molybdate transport system permease protein [Planctomycetota bacterium]
MLNAEEWGVLRLALGVALTSVALSVVPGVIVGWILARWRSRWRYLLHGIVMLPLVMPPLVTGYLLLQVFGRSGPLGRAWHAITGNYIAYTTAACVIAASVVGFPLLVEGVRVAIAGVDRRLEFVSLSLGRGRLQTFMRITLPLASPGLLAGLVLAFGRGLGEFGATIVLAGNIPGETRQIPIAVYSLLNLPNGEEAAMRLALVSVLFSLLVLAAAAWLVGRRGLAGDPA